MCAEEEDPAPEEDAPELVPDSSEEIGAPAHRRRPEGNVIFHFTCSMRMKVFPKEGPWLYFSQGPCLAPQEWRPDQLAMPCMAGMAFLRLLMLCMAA